MHCDSRQRLCVDRAGKAARVRGKSGTNQCFISVLLKNLPHLVLSFSEYMAELQVQQSSALTVLMLLCISLRKKLPGECEDNLQALTCPTLPSSPNAPHTLLVSHSMASQQPSRRTER